MQNDKMDEYIKQNMNEYLPLRDVVFNTLRQLILKGELAPGERLMEVALATRLGVSRRPSRSGSSPSAAKIPLICSSIALSSIILCLFLFCGAFALSLQTPLSFGSQITLCIWIWILALLSLFSSMKSTISAGSILPKTGLKYT